jgi:hypothetical protein
MKGEGHDMSAVGFAKRLDLVNYISGKRFRMRLEKEEPIESSKEVAPGGTAHVLEHTVSCRVPEAVAVLGADVEADGRAEGATVRLVLDGEDVIKGVLDEASAGSFADFLPTQCLFLAETPDGAKAGIFMPHGMLIHVVVTVPRSSRSPVKIRTMLRTAVYTMVEA